MMPEVWERNETTANLYKVIPGFVNEGFCDHAASLHSELKTRIDEPERTALKKPDGRWWFEAIKSAPWLFARTLKVNDDYFGFDVSAYLGVQIVKYHEGNYLEEHYDDSTYHFNHMNEERHELTMAPNSFRKFTCVINLGDTDEDTNGLHIYMGEDGKEIILKKGDAAFFSPYTLHSVGPVNGERTVLLIWFTGRHLK